MTTVLLVIHLFVTLALIGVVLIQRSEGGGLGIGSSQGMGGFMTGRGTANLLTRATAVLSTAFMVLSLSLALLNRGTAGVGRSLLDTPAATQPVAPGNLPASPNGAPSGGAPGIDAPGSAAPVAGTPAAPAPAAGPAGSAPASPAPQAQPVPPPSVPTN